MSLSEKPVVIYDGECRFCRSLAERWRRRNGDQVEFLPSGSAAARFPQIDPDRFEASIQWVVPPDAIYEGAEAVLRIVEGLTGRGFWLRCYQRVPGFAGLAEWLYRRVSRNRRCLSPMVRLLGFP